MTKVLNRVCIAWVAIILAGCAGQTTNPREGGLFSYNPKAYQQRLESRQEELSTSATDSEAAEQKTVALKDRMDLQAREKTALEQLLKDVTSETDSLEETMRSKQVKTVALQHEQKRILAEIENIKSATRNTDSVEDPEEKRLELERLRQRRDELEKEAAQLMLL